MKKLFLSLALAAAFATAAMADIAPVDPPKPAPKPGNPTVASKIEFAFRKDITRARLQIPRPLLNSFTAETAAATDDSGTFGSTSVIVGGSLMSLALVFGGLWMFRSPLSVARKTTAAAAVAVAAGSIFALVANANVGPPRDPFHLDSSIFTKKAIDGIWGQFAEIDVEIVPSGNRVRLLVPMEAAKDSNKKE